MSGTEAYRILSKSYPLNKVRTCLDYGKFYVFSLTPMDVPDDARYYSGTIFPAVDKRTGRIFEYDITSDVRAYHRAKEVKVKTIFDEVI